MLVILWHSYFLCAFITKNLASKSPCTHTYKGAKLGKYFHCKWKLRLCPVLILAFYIHSIFNTLISHGFLNISNGILALKMAALLCVQLLHTKYIHNTFKYSHISVDLSHHIHHFMLYGLKYRTLYAFYIHCSVRIIYHLGWLPYIKSRNAKP